MPVFPGKINNMKVVDILGNIYYGVLEIITPDDNSIYCDQFNGKTLNKADLEIRKNNTNFSSNRPVYKFQRRNMQGEKIILEFRYENNMWAGRENGTVIHTMYNEDTMFQIAQTNCWKRLI